MVRADNALIVNTKGGGHAFIGLHLAKKLLSQGHSVTILNDGDQAKLSAKAPFSQYASLPGATVVWGSPTDTATYPAGAFDVVRCSSLQPACIGSVIGRSCAALQHAGIRAAARIRAAILAPPACI